MKRRLASSPGKCFLCSAECEDTCEECDLFFCSPSHLRVHKQTGKCSPWLVKTRPSVGRVVVAARDIQPFELVMRDTALLGKVMVDAQACVVCGGKKVEDSCLRKCECGFQRCRSDCSDSQQHLEECSSLKCLNIPSMTLKEKNEIIQSLGFWRMIKYQQSDPEKWSSLMNLMSHQEERSKSKLFKKSVKHLIEKLHLLGANKCNEDLLSRLLGILDTNSHSFNKNIHHIFGNFSLLSHSCIPNSEHLLAGEQAIVRAKVEIRKGEEITIRYSDLCLHREILRKEMETSWLFNCSCPRCSDGSELGTEASSFKCDNCENGFVGVNVNQIECKNCNKIMSYKKFIAQAERLRKMELSSKLREDIPELIEEIEKNGGHALYHSVIQLKIQFMESSIDKMDSRTCHLVREFSGDVDRFMEVLNPGVSRLKGRLLVCIRKADNWLKKNEEDFLEENKESGRNIKLMEHKMMNGYFKC